MRPHVLASGIVITLTLLGCFCSSPKSEPTRQVLHREPVVHVLFEERFNSPELGLWNWTVTRKNGFETSTAEVVSTSKAEDSGKLRLRCSTMGTRPETVKYLGVVTKEALDISGRKVLSLDFDWNDQANGCYLTAGIYLCPTFTRKNPRDEPTWLCFRYVGVPPGKNARAESWICRKGRTRWVYDEGWPDEQRTGREIGKEHIEIHLNAGQWTVFEDGKLLYDSGEKNRVSFSKAHLYVQVSSHSNYPAREVYFDNVVIREKVRHPVKQNCLEKRTYNQ